MHNASLYAARGVISVSLLILLVKGRDLPT